MAADFSQSQKKNEMLVKSDTCSVKQHPIEKVHYHNMHLKHRAQFNDLVTPKGEPCLEVN